MPACIQEHTAQTDRNFLTAVQDTEVPEYTAKVYGGPGANPDVLSSWPSVSFYASKKLTPAKGIK